VDVRDFPVLVVDDNATNRRILHDMLTHWGMQPTTVESGGAALDILEHGEGVGRQFPLVLLDAHMPEMDGLTVAERIKKNPRLKGVTILMLSSSDQANMEVRCRQVGVTIYLRKPITRSELWEAMITALKRPEVQEAQEEQTVHQSNVHTLQQSVELTPRRRLRILLAEDNAVNQRLIVRLLEKHGHIILVANTGREVLAALTQQPIDLVLMDVQMPEMDGLEATAVIREQERQQGGHLPIIALTAHAMKGDQERCLATGMDDYISKPINAQTLSAAISRVLNDVAPLKFLTSELASSLAGAVDATG
jgi:two-component system, sensor histidine kinase and response regulator